MKGTVKWFNAKKGYGFITGEDDKEYFVHFKSINSEGYKTLSEKQCVTFTPSNNDRGAEATEVSVI